MKIEIKSRFDASLRFAHECGGNTIKITLEAAIKARAYLARAYLEGANLARAYLEGATYGVATIGKGFVSLIGLRWPVLFFDAHIKIGCQLHSTDEWSNFDDATIEKMSGEAAQFWKDNKAIILAIAKRHD